MNQPTHPASNGQSNNSSSTQPILRKGRPLARTSNRGTSITTMGWLNGSPIRRSVYKTLDAMILKHRGYWLTPKNPERFIEQAMLRWSRQAKSPTKTLVLCSSPQGWAKTLRWRGLSNFWITEELPSPEGLLEHATEHLLVVLTPEDLGKAEKWSPMPPTPTRPVFRALTRLFTPVALQSQWDTVIALYDGEEKSLKDIPLSVRSLAGFTPKTQLVLLTPFGRSPWTSIETDVMLPGEMLM